MGRDHTVAKNNEKYFWKVYNEKPNAWTFDNSHEQYLEPSQRPIQSKFPTKYLTIILCLYVKDSIVHVDTVAEWLRRSTRNRLGLSRVGSSPTSVDSHFYSTATWYVRTYEDQSWLASVLCGEFCAYITFASNR